MPWPLGSQYPCVFSSACGDGSHQSSALPCLKRAWHSEQVVFDPADGAVAGDGSSVGGGSHVGGGGGGGSHVGGGDGDGPSSFVLSHEFPMATRRVVPIACGVNCPWAGQYHRSINSRCSSVARLLKPNTCTLYIIFHIALTHVCRPFAASPERIVEKPDNFAINVHCPRPRFKPVIDLVQRVVHHLHLQVPTHNRRFSDEGGTSECPSVPKAEGRRAGNGTQD